MFKGRHYRNILILILVISSLPGIFIGGLLYWMGGGRLENELHQLHNDQIRQRAVNIDEQLQYLELTLSHWAFDPNFNLDLMSMDFERNFEVARDITKTLLVMQGSHPLAKKVELYLRARNPIHFNPEYEVLDKDSYIQLYDKLMSSNRSVYWTRMSFDTVNPEKEELTLVHKIPGGTLQPDGAVLVRVNEARLSSLLQTMTPYNVGETFLMQEDGHMIMAVQNSDNPEAFQQAIQRQVLQDGKSQGSFMLDWQGRTHTVSYGTFNRIGANWFYVSAAPINVITAPVVFISKLIIAVSVVALLLAACMSWLASRKLYSPIERVVLLLSGGRPSGSEHLEKDEFKLIEKQWQSLTRESMSLQTRLQEQLPHVKEGFLLQLVQGYLYSYSEQDLLERMKEYGWHVEDRQFVVLYVQLTGFAHLEGRFSSEDEGLVTFAAANIITELSSARLSQSSVINFHDLSIGVLAIVAEEEDRQQLTHFGEELMQVINQLLRMKVTVTVSKPTRFISHTPALFEETKQALSYRNFGSVNQFIDLELHPLSGQPNELRYPFTLEREVIQTLRTGQEQEAVELIGQFLETLQESGAKEIDVQQGMLQLLGNILHAIRVSGMNPNHLFNNVNMFDQLSQIRDTEDMLKWFRKRIVHVYIRELEARSDFHVKKMVETAMIYLQQNYMKDVSLDSCADYVGTNPYFLSKTFKQVTGKNFIDYLTELRMDKAKELLRDTEQRINDVAEQVGYQHSYFNRIFKKQEGLTPSQYREMSRQ
ncbi:helix-turn-helix domain-containing protein [Paenibacillus sp. y28]|uniref:helix-turn-helix domain-containing protein n=1 Tax=Paenibacillus sp. y28 TaxID=3129110 RepID=UPI00301ACF8A